MGLQLPGELASLLQVLGYNWPQADEEKLFDIGQRMMTFSSTLQNVVGGVGGAAAQVWQENKGGDIDAFASHWGHEEGPVKVLQDSSLASTLVGAGMMVCAGIVLALKIQVIVQLIALAIEIAQAIATAVVTFGASLAEIPIFQQITRVIVGELIDMVIQQLLNA